jgi:predicted Fe-Mo cluster-binding NifX family protein
MKVGITVWGKRISPVFDAARTLLIVELEEDCIGQRQQFQLWPGQTGEIVRLLSSSRVDVLICGAISQEPAEQIEANGIQLISFIAGRVDTVLEWYARGLSITGYQMPGCHGNGRGRGRRCCGADNHAHNILCDAHEKT